MDDLSCGPPGTVCCNDGCRKRCMDPFDFGTGGINREGEMHTTVPCASCLVLSSVIVYFDI